MGLLESQTMPFLRDVAHDGVFVHLVIDQSQIGASGVEKELSSSELLHSGGFCNGCITKRCFA
jgi:hypothetical protein